MVKIVRIIHNPQIIKLLADPVRREILRLLRHQPQTQTQLAKQLSISKPSTKHHIILLQQARLIKIAYMKVEIHGITQKYFEPTSSIFIIDFEKTPETLKKYFLQLHLERLRGILSAFQLMTTKQESPITVTVQELNDMAYEIAKQLVVVGKKYEKTDSKLNRETLLIAIYSEALNTVITKTKWKQFFDKLFLKRQEFLK